jgi:hypothetical protein
MSLKDMDSEDWQAVYENWKKSGLSQRKFCELQRIEYQAFAYRREKASLARTRINSNRVLPLRSPKPAVTLEFLKVDPGNKSLVFSWFEVHLPHETP